MNTSPASAGDLRARMKRPRVSFFFFKLHTVTREQYPKSAATLWIICGSNVQKSTDVIFYAWAFQILPGILKVPLPFDNIPI